MTPSTPSPSISPPTRQPGSPQQPIYGGNTTPGRISMTNGHQLASAKRRPDSTILVYTLPAPLRRLRFAVYRRPLLRGLACCPPRSATPSPCCAWNAPPPPSTPILTSPSPPRPTPAVRSAMPGPWQRPQGWSRSGGPWAACSAPSSPCRARQPSAATSPGSPACWPPWPSRSGRSYGGGSPSAPPATTWRSCTAPSTRPSTASAKGWR